jgi:hypothetical protein
MRNRTRTDHVGDDADATGAGRYAGYEDDGVLVICDRRNPRAWIRSDATTTADP